MSKIFYDHLIILDEVEGEIKETATSPEEKEELWGVVDDIVHHRVFAITLDHLPKKHHEEFLHKFHEGPHDESLIDYLSKKIGKNIEEIIKQEIGGLASELLQAVREELKENK